MMVKRPVQLAPTEGVTTGHPAQSDIGESDYGEVFLALGPLGKIMRYYGLFPVTAKTTKETGQGGLTFGYGGLGSVYTAVTFCGILLACYFMIRDYCLLIPNVLERIIITVFIALLCFLASVNLVAIASRSDQWPTYFRRCQTIDKWLGIRKDDVLRGYALKATLVFAIILTNSMASIILTIVMKYTKGDFSGTAFPIGLFFYGTSVYGCHMIPEIFFTYLCRVLAIRFQKLTRELTALFSTLTIGKKSDIRADIEKYRMTFHALMETVDQINGIMGPILLVTAIQNTFVLSVCVYTMSRQSIDNAGANFMQIMSVTIALARIIPVCLFANVIKTEVKKMQQSLFMVPTLRMSTTSVEEFHLFLKCAVASKPNFTGCDFLQIDRLLLKEVAQIIITYALTLIQFGEDLEDTSSSIKCPDFN